MGYKFTGFDYEWRTNPEALKQKILASFIECRGDREKMYADLGVSAFTYYHYIKELGLKERIRSMRLALNAQEQARGQRYAPARERSEPVIGTPEGRRSTVEDMPAVTA